MEKQEYQNAKCYKATSIPIRNIGDFARLVRHLSKRNNMLIVRGIHSRDKVQNTWRDNNAFPEHPDGTPWVMLDIDGVIPPEGISVVSIEAINWLIQTKLPVEFHNVTCFYQFSGSAGILDADGNLLKPGLRVHLFFMLDRRIPGYLLAAYLRRHCIDTGFYTIDANKGGVAQFKHGIDPSPIRTASQPHYVAHPMIEEGVQCLIASGDRDGLIQGEKEVASLPEIGYPLLIETDKLQKRLRNEWCREHGYQPISKQLLTRNGPVSMNYLSPPGSVAAVRLGRPLDRVDGPASGSTCRLFFSDEGTPGSWYVKKSQPQLAYRYGDGECIPLKEISEAAYVHVRDLLKWFTEVPSHNLALDVEGHVADFGTFVAAKYSLVLAPTGSGKTTKVISWMQHKAEQCVVVYVAQTIPLVNQMHDDLATAGIECFHYSTFQYDHTPQTGIFVTTNESLPKVLRCLSYGTLTPYCLVIDEIHMALDDICRSQSRLDRFCSAITQTRSAIFMTGTLTEIQRSMLAGTIARLEGGDLTEQKYCCYEFAPVKQNPLKICKLEYFRADVIELFEYIRAKHVAGEDLPRVMLMLSTSKMEMFRILAESYGMADLVDIVSRPECLQEDIEAARVSDKPILVTSPLFSVGLNLVRQLKVLYCRFDHLDADTSRVIQTINRANRGDTACEVRIYANPDDEPFFFPLKVKVIDQMREALEAETDVANNATDMPVLLDRMAYREYRKIESNPNQAIGQLIRENSFQNYQVIECLESSARDKEKTQQFQELKKAADELYDERVLERFPRFDHDVADCHFFRLQCLGEEGRNWKANYKRTPREIEEDELAVLMQLCDLDKPSNARKISKNRIRALFGDREPWLSDNANATHYSHWATAAATKTGAIIAVIEALRQMGTGHLDGIGFAKKLNKNKALQEGIRALAKDERDYLSLDNSFRLLADLRERVRKCNTFANNKKAEDYALKNMAMPFLESIGVFFPVEGEGKGRGVNYKVPLVPESWNFDQMIAKLNHRKALLQALPSEYSLINRKMDPDAASATIISVCRGCKFFDAACCALAHRIDWTEEGYELHEAESSRYCNDRHPIRHLKAA